MDIGHPRDVDPSITGQPHQVTGKVPGLMGNTSRTLGNPMDMPAAVRILVPPHLVVRVLRSPRDARNWGPAVRRKTAQAAPRCSASQTAMDSRAPSSTALPQWAIQAAMPSGVPET